MAVTYRQQRLSAAAVAAMGFLGGGYPRSATSILGGNGYRLSSAIAITYRQQRLYATAVAMGFLGGGYPRRRQLCSVVTIISRLSAAAMLATPAKRETHDGRGGFIVLVYPSPQHSIHH